MTTSYEIDREPTYRLTPKQKRILEEVAKGLQTKQIAELLGVDYYTVREHLVRARTNLGAKNTTHAVVIAIRLGLVDIEYPSSKEEALRCVEFLKKYVKSTEV